METQTNDGTNLRMELRTLFQERAMSTRLLVISVLADAGDVDNILARLRHNQEEIGTAVCRHFKNSCLATHPEAREYARALQDKSHPDTGLKLEPDEAKWLSEYTAGNMLTAMLKSGVTVTKNLITAKRKGDLAMELSAREALKENAISTASFLYSLNPNCSYEPLKNMMISYMEAVEEQTMKRMCKEYGQDLAAYDLTRKIALEIADAIAAGLNVTTAPAA